MRIRLFVLLCMLPFFTSAAPLFPGADVFESTAIADDRFNLAVGGMEKQDGVWQPEQSLKVSINGYRLTHEIGYEVTVHEAFNFYADAYKSKVVSQLFSCEGLDCGSSAQWANGYFGVRELYGPDREQRLAVWLIEAEGKQQLITLYVIQRGNKKVYAHVDEFTLTKPMTTEVPRSELISTVFSVDGMRSDELRDLARSIRDSQAKGFEVWLVGHAYGSAEQSVNLQTSLAIAESLAAKLSLLGVANVNVDAVGMLSPTDGMNADRVVLLAIRLD